jgi:glucose dehydrogenase
LFTDSIIAVRGATGKYVWHYQEIPGDDWDLDSTADMTLADLTINGRSRKVIMHAPKNGFFYVLDRITGEFLAADPWTLVNWASGVDPKTGRPIVNPGARYGTTPVNVIPGPGGGHVWPPMSFNPETGLVYIPGTMGSGTSLSANPNYTPLSTDIGETGRGAMNMGTGSAGASTITVRAAPPTVALAPELDLPLPGPPLPIMGAGAGAPSESPSTSRGAANAAPLPTIGPQGRGSVLVAWDPVERKERWRGPAGSSAGFNAGGTLTTAGNLVFTHVPNGLQVFRANDGTLLANIQTGFTNPGPPITYMVDGKQYIIIAGTPLSTGPARGNAVGGSAARLMAFSLDGGNLPKP